MVLFPAVSQCHNNSSFNRCSLSCYYHTQIRHFAQRCLPPGRVTLPCFQALSSIAASPRHRALPAHLSFPSLVPLVCVVAECVGLAGQVGFSP